MAQLTLIATLVLTLQSLLSAHDIPSEVVIHTFVKPEGARLHVLVRVPLTVLRDVNLPRRGPDYLALEALDQPLRQAAASLVDGVGLFENDVRLRQFEIRETQIALPSDKSFATYEEAMAHLRGPKLPEKTEVVWNQGFFDVRLDYLIQSDRSDFSLRMFLATGRAGRTLTMVRFLPSNGTTRAYELENDAGLVRLDPRWHQAAWGFVKSGVFHIFRGIDHLLFLFCLVIPFRRFSGLIAVVMSFTVAHSITLIASALSVAPGGSWFPLLIELLIAVSIVYMAVENVVAANLKRRWLITFVFGLVHGFGFSFAFRQTLQFAGSHHLVSLLSFNAGVELGQIMLLAIMVPAVRLFFQYTIAERVGTIVLSALIAHTGWHWMTERGGRLWLVEWPAPDLMLAATLVRWLLFLVVAAAAIWLITSLRWPRSARQAPSPRSVTPT